MNAKKILGIGIPLLVIGGFVVVILYQTVCGFCTTEQNNLYVSVKIGSFLTMVAGIILTAIGIRKLRKSKNAEVNS